ncbi:MAG: carbohydrate ABC transporter permease [Sedimentisphaerales bacterium]|nr:carbohydrate ABC transporter permease [Sedimentisphaerales bacterium]
MKLRPQKILLYAVLLAVSGLFVFPFYWLLISSVKSREGMSMNPPTLYPARPRTMDLTCPVTVRLVRVGEHTWCRLCESQNLLEENAASGAYYIQLKEDQPTQQVQWFADNKVQPIAEPKFATITFTAVPVHKLMDTGRNIAVVGRLVRKKPVGFDEILFVPATENAAGEFSILQNVTHHALNEFAPRWSNYPETLKGPEATFGQESIGFLRYMRNSFFISFMAVIGQVLSSSLVAFAFARLRFPGRDGLFIVLLATLMVPGQVTLIPLFWIYKSLGWVNTFLPLIVPHFMAGAFSVFLIRQYMLTLPKELDESAAIDGCGALGTFRHIIFPNCKPVLIVVAIFTFVYTWQDIMGPLIYLDNPAYRTVTLGLEYFRSPYVDNRHLIMTGAVLAMLPVAVVFMFLQRYIMSGIATTGIKG